MEVFDGARPLEHISRWLAGGAFEELRTRVLLAERARRLRGVAAKRITYQLGPVHRCDPAEGVIEACVTVFSTVRSRAIVLRLEGQDGRWRATVLSIM